MKPGYYIDNEDCLWIVYPDKACDYHLNGKEFWWMSATSVKSDRWVFGLTYLSSL